MTCKCKDYRVIADALLSARNAIVGSEQLTGWNIAVSYTADALKRDNPNFKRETFYKACGV